MFGIDLSDVLVYLAGACSAAIVLLKVIAPRTSNKTDDKVLETLEKVRPYLPAKGSAEATTSVDAVSRERVRDHRGSAQGDGVPALDGDDNRNANKPGFRTGK